MTAPEQVLVTMSLEDGYRFLIDFHQPEVPSLVVDEPEPLGGGSGPNAARLLAAAVANCLSASALFCLRKARVPVHGMHTSVEVSYARDDRGHLRLGGLDVRIQPEVPADDITRMSRCLALFEDYCAVTESVRAGLGVSVAVEPVPTPVGGSAAAT
jgi:uncharacterized OsmC-like protein